MKPSFRQVAAAVHVPQGPSLPQLRKNGARLLALDGGGVKGVSSALILDNIMDRVKRIEQDRGVQDPTNRKPKQYFDLAAGTSTGGLIALMLFRLHMDVPQCRDSYHALAHKIFAPRFLGSPLLGKIFGKLGLMLNAIFGKAEFDGQPLVDAIHKVVNQYPLKPEDPDKYCLVHPESGMM